MSPTMGLWSYIFALFCFTTFGGICDASADSQKHQPDGSPNPPLRVAIVGAGIAGASAAFHLQEISRSGSMSITIYDKEAIVGGRVVSLSPSEAAPKVFEAGAPGFFTDDDCLTKGMKSTGSEFPFWHIWPWPRRVGLWNGQGIVGHPSCNLESPAWRHLARLITRYGISAWRFHRKVASISKRWKTLGVLHTFDNISHELKDANLGEDIIFSSSETYFRELGISAEFLSEVVEPCVRSRFSQNLANVSALSVLMAVRGAKESWVGGGNARLIERMINLSGADLHLNSTVLGITEGDTQHYRLSVTSSPLTNPPNIVYTEYDVVILAFPLHKESINLNFFNISKRLTESFWASNLYADSHVTHFSTSSTISSTFFQSSLNEWIPHDLLTTAQSSNVLSTSHFWVCYVRNCYWDDECDQCDNDEQMYRVVSHQPLSDADLVGLIGQKWHEGRILAYVDVKSYFLKHWRDTGRLPEIDIGWVHRQAWPRALPTLSENGKSGAADKIEIAPKLFYLGGAEQVLSSMEMSCRMGRNVARLLTTPSMSELDVSHSEL